MPINIKSPANVQKNNLMVFPAGEVVGDHGHLIYKNTNANLLSKIENIRVHLLDTTLVDAKASLYGYNGTSYFAIAENISLNFDGADDGYVATIIDESTPLWLENTGSQIHSLYGKVTNNASGKTQFIIDFEQYSDVSTFPINNTTEHDAASSTASTFEFLQNQNNQKWEVFDNDLPDGSVTFTVTGGGASYVSPTSGTINITNGYGFQNFNVSSVPSSQTGTITASNGASTNFNIQSTVDIEFRVYGAGGGPGSNYSGNSAPSVTPRSKGGDGGYAQGTLAGVIPGTVFYIVVGQAGSVVTGQSALPPNTFNGGGRGSSNFYGGLGGGASHVATNTGVLTTHASNTGNVIIVAGGGGGGGNVSWGGDGGGANGQTPATSTQFQNRSPGSGASQNSGGGGNSAFGIGGYTNTNLTGGGGGGWYGGGTGANSTGAGGGSGYVGFTGQGNIPALTNVTITQGGHTASGGYISPNSSTGNTQPTVLQNSVNGKIEVYKNGALDTTFNYTGAVQTYTA